MSVLGQSVGGIDAALVLSAQPEGPKPASRLRRAIGWFRISRHHGFITLLIFIGAWWLIASLVVRNILFLATPLQAMQALVDSWRQGQLELDLRTSGAEFAWGFFPSAAIGTILGMLLGVSNRVKGYIDPALNAWSAIPIVALIPLFVVWFGIGEEKTIVIAALLVFVTCTINTDIGIRSTETKLLEAARSFGASRVMLFTKVRVPSALPFIITGIRLAIGRGILGVVAGEFFGSSAGIGDRIAVASASTTSALVFGCIIITAVVGVGLVYIMEWVERKVAPWRVFQMSQKD